MCVIDIFVTFPSNNLFKQANSSDIELDKQAAKEAREKEKKSLNFLIFLPLGATIDQPSHHWRYR